MGHRQGDKVYRTQTWADCAKAYKASKQGLCERCLRRGIISAGLYVHHKIHLNAETVEIPEIAYGFDNLELLCARCHYMEHAQERTRGRQRRYAVTPSGEVVAR